MDPSTGFPINFQGVAPAVSTRPANPTFDRHTSSLDKVIAPVFAKRRELLEKVIARTFIVDKLQDHKAKKTFPPELPSIRTPQIPESVAADFKTAFEEVMTKAKTELLDKMIYLRRQDIRKLEEEVVSVEHAMKKDVTDYKLQVMTEEDKEVAVTRYCNELNSRLSDQANKLWTKARCDKFIKEKKKNEAEEARIRMEIEPHNDSQVQSLQKTVKTLEKSLKTLEKKVSTNPVPNKDPPKSNKSDGKSKSKDNKKKDKDKDKDNGNKNKGKKKDKGGQGKGKGGKGRAANQG